MSEVKIVNADPFDLESCRLSPEELSGTPAKKVLTNVRVTKPSKEWFVRRHPDHYLDGAVIELKDEREIYLIGNAALRAELSEETTCGARRLVLAVTRQGQPFIWPLRLPSTDGRLDSWSLSALEASERATKNWVRVVSNLHAGCYDVYEPTHTLPDPEWPEMPFPELLKIAFKNYVIADRNHPVLKKLRGEV